MIDITARLNSREQAARSSPPQTSAHFNHENKRVDGPLVLVVEDHAATQNVLSSVLDLQGYQVVCTANGQEALEWLNEALQTEQQPPAIILLDLFMPVMNGADFLAAIRAHWTSEELIPPVILFTVDQGNHDDLACAEVLPKPFHIRDLLAKLKLVLGQEQRI
jgi:CheY-like chemotaxis protein